MTHHPVELRHVTLKRAAARLRPRAPSTSCSRTSRDSFEEVWRDRADLADHVEQLEGELVRHRELETLLRTTLVSAEQARPARAEGAGAARRPGSCSTRRTREARAITRAARAERERLLDATAPDPAAARGRARRGRRDAGSRRRGRRRTAAGGASLAEPILATRWRSRSTRLRLRVVPGARRSEVVGRHGEAWKVRVGARARARARERRRSRAARRDARACRAGALDRFGPRRPGQGRRAGRGIDRTEPERRLRASAGRSARAERWLDTEHVPRHRAARASGERVVAALDYLHEENRGSLEDESRGDRRATTTSATRRPSTFDRELDYDARGERASVLLRRSTPRSSGSRTARTGSARTAASRSARSGSRRCRGRRSASTASAGEERG